MFHETNSNIKQINSAKCVKKYPWYINIQ